MGMKQVGQVGVLTSRRNKSHVVREKKKMQKPGLGPAWGAPRERKGREVGLPCRLCSAAKEESRKALRGLLLHARREGNSKPR